MEASHYRRRQSRQLTAPGALFEEQEAGETEVPVDPYALGFLSEVPQEEMSQMVQMGLFSVNEEKHRMWTVMVQFM